MEFFKKLLSHRKVFLASLLSPHRVFSQLSHHREFSASHLSRKKMHRQLQVLYSKLRLLVRAYSIHKIQQTRIQKRQKVLIFSVRLALYSMDKVNLQPQSHRKFNQPNSNLPCLSVLSLQLRTMSQKRC